MDVEHNINGVSLAVYAFTSFLLVLFAITLIYVACAKRYRLNWFEKNLLETADTAEMNVSQEALMIESEPGSSRSPSRDKFWVPHNLQRQASVENFDESSDDNSIHGSVVSSRATPPPSTSSPYPTTSSAAGPGAAGVASTSASSGAGVGAGPSLSPSLLATSPQPQSDHQPCIGTDRHIILTPAPPRPKVSSMHTKLDYRKIDTSLYQKPQKSLSEPEEYRGSVHLTIFYDPTSGNLSVRLIEAQDLQARDFSGTADPYAKIRLLPDKGNVWQTRIHRKTLNPFFDEDFVFDVKPTTIARRTLEIIIYDFDAYSRHLAIGGMKIPLAQIDLAEKIDFWKKLTPCAEPDAKVDLGELRVSLAYLPGAERLNVNIIEARNLRVVDLTRSSSDPYVRVQITGAEMKDKRKKKTSVQRNTVCPVFNELLHFSMNRETLSKCKVEFTVHHDGLLGTSELGRAVIVPEHEKYIFNDISSTTDTSRWLALSD
ncbi:synaptotagmin-5 isoform X1 [Bemisia tabaci]